MKTITIDPVTRIEGHAKITIQLDDAGKVHDAQFHVMEFRGFEKFCEGRPFQEMPSLTARICGICPVSHLLASGKACDALMAVEIPETGTILRRLLNLAQFIQSHALSFFYLSAPDIVARINVKPAERNILGLTKTNPELVYDGVHLRQFGQQTIEALAGKRIHPTWVVPGGVSAPLSNEARERIRTGIPDALTRIQRVLDGYKTIVSEHNDEARTFANFPTLFMGLVTPKGELEHYDGRLRIMDEDGHIVEDQINPSKYQGYIEEATLPYSYLKAPYYKPRGFPDGVYRVGPLARLNVIDHIGTPKAEAEWVEYRALRQHVILSNFHNHYARLIEILYALERMQQLLDDPAITSAHVRAEARPNNEEGVGVTEAPRGTLIHHYQIDKNGLISRANLIVATGHNNLAMNRGVLQVAKQYVNGTYFSENMLNRVEAVIRSFDPCLSCSTHALGKMPIQLTLIDSTGRVIDQLTRS